MIRIFAGYDPRLTTGYHVFCHSVFSRTFSPVSICPLSLQTLSTVFNRKRDPLQSTDFSFSRFLIPFLCDYEGWALFCDSTDMICLDDIRKLWDRRDSKYAVQVVKQIHNAAEGKKFLDEPQSAYGRKNWSSLILFNNARCRALTPQTVESRNGLYLHQFKWLEDAEIGELPLEWNHLVGVHETQMAVSMAHYTLGTPNIVPCHDEIYRKLWFHEYSQFAETMKHGDTRETEVSDSKGA